MGMSIDDARREMISGKPYTDKFAMALVVAIDTMRKYQKIEQIVNSKTTRLSYDVGFKQIKEVVEDGNDNR